MTTKLTVNDLIYRIGELPPLPQIAEQALALARNPDTNMSDIAAILSMDQAMTSLILRSANSTYYGLKYPVSTMQQAVTVLGIRTLQNLIIASSLASYLDRPAVGYALDRGELWKHSIGVAAGARLLCAPLGNVVAEEAYTAGLLCDIGKLAFEVLLRDVDTSAADWQQMPFSELEASHFGIDHASLGAEIASRWRLPASLIDAIRYHHQPSHATIGADLTAAVHIADTAMMVLGIGIGKDGLQYQLDEAACKRMNWNDAMLESLLDRVVPFIEEADKLIHRRR
jgi:putative nucleotidyltransferase with HDIG domain